MSSDFFWGVACSAFQVEGNPMPSDWLEWTKIPEKILDASNANQVTNFFEDYETDLKLAKELGVNSFRISIAWERIEPAANQWNEEALIHYEKMISKIRDYEMEPIICLQHFVIPQWLSEKGGILADDFVSQFSNYAEKVVWKLSKGPASVKYWLTLNEPMVLALQGYFEGNWPPGMKNVSATLKAADALAHAHIEAVRKIRRLPLKGLQISIAHHWRAFVPATKSPFDYIAAKAAAWIFNQQFLNAVHTGKFLFWAPGAMPIIRGIDLPENRSTIDFIGINYYGRIVTSISSTPPFLKTSEGEGEKSDLGWAIYPEGLYRCIEELSKFKLPIFITENGLADTEDAKRSNFLETHLSALIRAKKDGHPVMGYLHWSLTDNFEWTFGISAKFGLVGINYETLERKPRDSFYYFKNLIKTY